MANPVRLMDLTDEQVEDLFYDMLFEEMIQEHERNHPEDRQVDQVDWL